MTRPDTNSPTPRAHPLDARRLRRVVSPKWLLPIGVIGTIVIGVAIVGEYFVRKQEQERLLENQAVWIVETLAEAAGRELQAAGQIEETFRTDRTSELLLVRRLVTSSRPTTSELESIRRNTGFDHLFLCRDTSDISRALGSRWTGYDDIGKRLARAALGAQRPYVVDLPRRNEPSVSDVGFILPIPSGGYLTAVVNAERLLQSSPLFGFGSFLRQFRQAEGIAYIALQDDHNILAGALGDFQLSSFATDSALASVQTANALLTRKIVINERPILEVIAPFRVGTETLGVLRCGISMADLSAHEAALTTRLLILIAAVALFGVIFAAFNRTFRHRQQLAQLVDDLHEYSSSLLNNLETGVITVAADGAIELATERAARLLERSQADLIADGVGILPDPIRVRAQACLKGELAFAPEETFRARLHDANRTLAFRIQDLGERVGSPRLAVLIDDITDREQLEQQRHRNEKLGAMTRLASVVAHEIRNPLNAIRLTIATLLRRSGRAECKDTDPHEHLASIDSEIDRIATLVEEFVQFTRPLNTRKESVDIAGLFNDLHSLYEGHRDDGKLSITFSADPGLICTADDRQLRQLLINLVNNAIEAVTPPGTITVSAARDGDRLHMTVADSGRGIPSEDIDRIFDLYYTTKAQGSGIGLAVVNQIVANHNGTIRVDSEPGVGTRVQVTLPIGDEV
ncbi:MAG TPA: ATP-binding protein [Acidobacteriota bacterium]|nr:ATP-binding protein [Acidobacteriota bacterium]